MEVSSRTVVVIGGAGFIGSHDVNELLGQDVGRVVIYGNLTRGRISNVELALRDPRCEVFPSSGDTREVNMMSWALVGARGVVHLTAMWLLHCMDYS